MIPPILLLVVPLAILALAGLAWSGYRQRQETERRIERRMAEYARRRVRGQPEGV